MPTYALLGATGSTGSAILRYLIENPPQNLTLNISVRSASKLKSKFPELESTSSFQVNIIEGTPADLSTMQRCLKDADVVFNCIGSTSYSRGQTVVEDSAKGIIKALQSNRSEQGATAFKTPTILQNCSVTLNKTLNREQPALVLSVLKWTLDYAYSDITRACEAYESAVRETPGLLETIYVDPPALHDAEGTTRTGHKFVSEEGMSTNLSYADLGAAFCELAEWKAEFAGGRIGVAATGEVRQNWPGLVWNMVMGAKGRIIG